MMTSEEEPCTDQNTEHGQANTSSLNSSGECECDNLTRNNNDEMTGSESKSETAKTGGDDELSREKVLKKPDKILPCPRCKSMDTKFCYYNNYNVKQPRHFCKSCQRYWTAGGSMRNIPVGAGRRKSKSSGSDCRGILIPGGSSLAPPVAVGDTSICPLSVKGNQAAVKFGPDSPLCNSMASVLKIGEQSNNADPAPSTAQPRNGETQTCAPSTSDSTQSEPIKGTASGHYQSGSIGQCNGITSVHPIPCFPGPPFVYPWGPAWNGIPAMTTPVCPAPAEAANSSENGNTSNVQWRVPPMVPIMPPGFCGPLIPFPVTPPSVWPFITPLPNGGWSPSWLGPGSNLSASSPTGNGTCSDSTGPPALGKHSRDSKPQSDDKSERCLWIPKTLRIDDPDEAAKSSIWTTLGIERGEKRGMFRPFESKPESREQKSGATQEVLQANPAAMSRSRLFQETT